MRTHIQSIHTKKKRKRIIIIEYISQSYQNKYHKGHDALEQGGTSYTLEVHDHFKYSSKTSTKKQKHIVHFSVEREA